MSNQTPSVSPEWHVILRRALNVTTRNWPLKLLSLLIALLLWGGLISQDASLTREKTFSDVGINIINRDSLRRSGLVVTEGLDALESIKMKAEVPQKLYDTVSAGNFNVRVDLSRITKAGTQKLPVLYTSSSTYGTVTWLSTAEITVEVDDYITRRRIPVQLNETGAAPSGFYATAPGVDPAAVTISGPRGIIQNITRCVADYNASLLLPAARTQLNAVPFKLYDADNRVVSNPLIEVSSDSVLLDTLMVEQTLYRLKPVSINTSGAVTGRPQAGFKVTGVLSDPAMINVAGSSELMETLSILDLEAPVDITGASETLIRSVRLKRPDGALHVSENAVYITVVIEPVESTESGKKS